MKKKKITKDTIPEGFSLLLAIVDILPVIFFSLALMIFSYRTSFYSYHIILGGIMVIISGLIKVLWKIIAALKKECMVDVRSNENNFSNWIFYDFFWNDTRI